jgi:hypothetical protein
MKWRNKLKQILGGDSDNSQQLPSKDKRTIYDDTDCDGLLSANSNVINDLNDKVVDQVRRYLTNQEDVTSQFALIKQNGIMGIAYHPNSDISLDVCRGYLFQLKNRHTSVGYVQKLALHQVKGDTEVLSYYLKPSMRLQNSVPAEQLYGNVTLEIKLVRGVIKHVKAAATYYSDANYKQVRQWQEWYSVIFLSEKFNL